MQRETPRCKTRGVLGDRTWRDLEPGDHIYTWWRSSAETHHGIYEGKGKVIYYKCHNQKELHSVVCSSIDDFLSGGQLYIFEYNVNRALFLAKPGGNTCTITSADPTEDVLDRAHFLLENSSVGYHPYIKNCYDFAIYCKTGLIMFTSMNVSRNEPVASTLAVTAFVFFSLLQRLPASFNALAATALGIYSTFRLALDIGTHPNAIKVEVERFDQVERLASDCFGFRRTICFLFKLVSVALVCAFISLAFSMWSYESRLLVWGLAGIKFLYWPLFHRTFKFRWLFSNKLPSKHKLKLKRGDHIYTWRRGYSYAHHGIYVDKETVIHLTRGEGFSKTSSSYKEYNNPDQEKVIHHLNQRGGSTKPGQMIQLAQRRRGGGGGGGGPRRPGQITQHTRGGGGGGGSKKSRTLSQAYINPGGGQPISISGDDRSKRDRVEICSIDDFLDGGELYLYDYGVDLAFFIAKSRGGTCTLAYSDPPALVRHRALFLWETFSFGAYNLFYNNCEDFAIYCKTGLIVPRIITIGRSGQTTAYAALICALISIPYSLMTGSHFVGVAVVGYVLYSIWRLFSDTGYRTDARKVPVEGLAAFQTFTAFMYRQLLFTLVPKFLCYAILIRTFWFPGATWTIRSQNCLLDWIITVAFLWAAFF